MSAAGGLGVVEMMALDYFSRREKMETIVKEVKASKESCVNINPICKRLSIELTPEEFNWIVEQVKDY